jgi:hypothetical protein
MNGTKLFLGGWFACAAIRGAVMSAHKLTSTEDLALALLACFESSLAVWCIGTAAKGSR